MIAFLRGRLVAAEPGQVVVDVGGVGYRLQVPAGTLARLPAPGEEVRLHAVLQVREDSLNLYGFATREEKALFEMLVAVNGIGPRLALAALSTLGPAGLAGALAGGDARALARVPGIGTRTAERLVLELRERAQGLALPSAGGGEGAAVGAAFPPGGPEAEAAAALEALGYGQSEAAQAVAAVRSDGAVTAEEMVRRALRRLAGGR